MTEKAPGPHYIVRSDVSGAYLGIDKDGDPCWYDRFIQGKRFTSELQARTWADDNVHPGYTFTVERFSVH